MAGDMNAVRMLVQVLYERWPNLDRQESITTQTTLMGPRDRVVSNLMRNHNNKSSVINWNGNKAEKDNKAKRSLEWWRVIGG